jgi:hypothetical protein
MPMYRVNPQVEALAGGSSTSRDTSWALHGAIEMEMYLNALAEKENLELVAITTSSYDMTLLIFKQGR